jgi:hypothetical protein
MKEDDFVKFLIYIHTTRARSSQYEDNGTVIEEKLPSKNFSALKNFSMPA